MEGQARKARKAVVACYSFKGHDFGCRWADPEDRRYAKRVTRRSERRLSKALCRED